MGMSTIPFLFFLLLELDQRVCRVDPLLLDAPVDEGLEVDEVQVVRRRPHFPGKELEQTALEVCLLPGLRVGSERTRCAGGSPGWSARSGPGRS